MRVWEKCSCINEVDALHKFVCPWPGRNVDVEQSGVTGLDSCHGDPHRFTSISEPEPEIF